MGDAIEDMKAVAAHGKATRAAAWENRGEAVARIESAGFTVKVLSEESRHLRISAPSLAGYFDFWPSTDRWAQISTRPRSHKAGGFGVDDLLAALAAAVKG